MTIAPEPVLHSALATIHYATVCARNWTYSDDVSREQINQLMDAIHAIPHLILNWNSDGTRNILLHLSCFDTQRWRAVVDGKQVVVPDFAVFFQHRLDEWSNQGSP